MGFARPITAEKSNDSFVKDYVFSINGNKIILKCLIDTGADKSLVNEDVVTNYKRFFYNVNPVTFRSLTTTFKIDKKLTCVVKWNLIDMINRLYMDFLYLNKNLSECRLMPLLVKICWSV